MHPVQDGIAPVAETKSRSFVSAQQVADLAGVSRSAVSRTFTDGASVSDATRGKVLRAAEHLGYHVNHLARSLIQEQSGIVCLIVADVATPYQSRMLDALTRRLQAIDRYRDGHQHLGRERQRRGGAQADAQLPGRRHSGDLENAVH
jgi:predicted transcriptional regulator